MKVLLINCWIHPKNHNAIKQYKSIEWVETTSIETVANLETFDCVFSPSGPIDVSKYPSTFFLLGPHFSNADYKLNCICGPNAVVNMLSTWVKIYFETHISARLVTVTLPFGVDTKLFQEIRPRSEKTDVLLYFKNRKTSELQYIQQYLNSLNIHYNCFIYTHYKEEDYINCLQNSKYGIWIGRHESQGFALEEALACNVPLLVWDVTSMNQEVGHDGHSYQYDDIPATCIPYWDERCGETFYSESEFHVAFHRFMTHLPEYRPRDYVVENLSIEVCERKFMDIIRENKQPIHTTS